MINNDSISYSLEALRVKAKFYGKKAMIYVEGRDDINFWDQFFDRNVFELESVGGFSNLKSYIEKLEKNEKSFIVACDSDYSYFTKSEYSSALIVTTYGHSIENMMYCPFNLSEVVRKLSKSSVESVSTIEKWFDTFIQSAHPLLLREIINVTYRSQENKVEIFGRTCAPFCKNNPDYELDDSKIAKFCKDNESYFPEDELERIDRDVQRNGRGERYLIKGHFLTEGIRRLIIYLASKNSLSGRRVRLSQDELYALTVHCPRCGQIHCCEKEFLMSHVEAAIKELRI